MTWLTSVGSALRRGTLNQTGWTWDERRNLYALNDAYYANTAYDRTSVGGYRDALNAELGNAQAADLSGLYNPVKAVVDLYLHIFRGRFGKDITITPTGSGGERLTQAIADVWRWSNMTVEQKRLCRLPALHGMCGIRIVGRDSDDPAMRRVYLKVEHPRTIRDMQLDDRGNVQRIQLEYTVRAGLGEDAKDIEIQEELTPETIRTWRDTGSNVLLPFDLQAFQADGSPLDKIDDEKYATGAGADYENPLGVTPYVVAYYDEDEGLWGVNAWSDARGAIDRYNALLSHIDIQVHQHVRATWLVAAGGQAPTEMNFSGNKIIYANTSGGQSPPVIQPLIANLDLTGAIMQSKEQLTAIEDMLPELKATRGKFLSGQSGETIAELRKPAEDALGLARASLEDALGRAQQIAVSWGIMLGVWNIGTGTGDRDAAERAFREGYEDHEFNPRPLLNGVASAQPATMPARDEGVAVEDVNTPQEAKV